MTLDGIDTQFTSKWTGSDIVKENPKVQECKSFYIALNSLRINISINLFPLILILTHIDDRSIYEALSMDLHSSTYENFIF